MTGIQLVKRYGSNALKFAQEKGGKVLTAAAGVGATVVAHAQNATVDTSALQSQVTGAQSTATNSFLGFAGIAVGAFVLGAIIRFSRKGAAPR